MKFVYNSKNETAERGFPAISADVGESSPVSWSVALWRSPVYKEKEDGKERTYARSRLELFEEILLPHLDAAHNLARWLMRNQVDAQDVVQESYLRAFRFFDGYKGGDGKAWLLTIVRNTCRTWHQRNNREADAIEFDEIAHYDKSGALNQEESLLREERIGALRTCIEALPIEFREVLILRELEEMSYGEIAEVTGVALGTVMSRLSRGRKRLEDCVANRARRSR